MNDQFEDEGVKEEEGRKEGDRRQETEHSDISEEKVLLYNIS